MESSKVSEFKSIGGQMQLVQRSPKTAMQNSGSLPALGTGNAAESSAGFKQRGILSEVVKPHRATEVQACRLGPEVSKSGAVRKSASATSFKMSKKLRDAAAEALPVQKQITIREVQPKVVEVYDHLAGARPRKVTVERRKKRFDNMDIDSLLAERGISFRPGNWKDLHWLNLQDFDNTEYDIRTPIEWIQTGLQEGAERLPVQAKALRFGEDGGGTWEACAVYSWNAKEQLFMCKWVDQDGTTKKGVSKVTRLQVLFDGEDPEVFADRVQFAFEALHRVQARAKLNFFIDNMPIDDIQCLDVDQVARILDNSKSNAGLRDPAIEGPPMTSSAR
jgi:hypothetical protein